MNNVKKILRTCLTCFRNNPHTVIPIMGNLPRGRTKIMYPFHSTGIDFAGPFNIKDRNGRGCKVSKAYLCVFVRMSTKCLHLKLITDLTTQAFMATLRKFIARCGKPQNIFTDNGTTFKGAKNELLNLRNFIKTENKHIQNNLSDQGIAWHFIPPYTPNFGGLWKAGVKSAKYHIKRTIGNAILTYEDFSTLLTQIESVLNSRPLAALTSDPNDPEPLTPAHFRIGRSFNTIPDPDVSDRAVNRLNRFQHLQYLVQQFWKQWSKSYIAELQQRTKWKNNVANVNIGALVLIREDNIPPARWLLGRITTLHPGQDGVVRVVTVQCKSGSVVRPISKICVLPIEADHSQ